MLSGHVMPSNSTSNRSRAVVLLSGGMDSCVCAALAVRDHQAAAVHVSYGQRTEAARTALLRKHLRPARNSRPAAGAQRSSALDRRIRPHRSEHCRSRSARHRCQRVRVGIPVTYVPFRNAHFLAVAVSWAEVLGAEKVYIGAVEPDSSGYPDCRPEYYRAFNEVVKAGTKEGTIRVVTPLIAMRKRRDCDAWP